MYRNSRDQISKFTNSCSIVSLNFATSVHMWSMCQLHDQNVFKLFLLHIWRCKLCFCKYMDSWRLCLSYKRVTPPLRTAYRPILALRFAYHHFLASRTAYRLKTKTTIFGVSNYIKNIKWQYVTCTCTIILALMCLLVIYPSFRPPNV